MSRTFVRSNSCSSCGLKSRPRSCPYTLVVQGSGVLATGGREFPIGKAAGRNASEPRCSLVSDLKMPTQWTYGEGQCSAVWRTEAAAEIFRGSRDIHWRNCSRSLTRVRWHLEERMRTHLRKRHKIRDRKKGIIRFADRDLYGKYGLYKVPTTAGWTKANALR